MSRSLLPPKFEHLPVLSKRVLDNGLCSRPFTLLHTESPQSKSMSLVSYLLSGEKIGREGWNGSMRTGS